MPQPTAHWGCGRFTRRWAVVGVEGVAWRRPCHLSSRSMCSIVFRCSTGSYRRGSACAMVLGLLPGWLGLDTEALDVSMWEIAKVVLVFLGIPLAAGFLTRLIGGGPREPNGTSNGSCPVSPPSPCTACCSRSSCCSRCRATRSPASRGTSCASRCRCSPTSIAVSIGVTSGEALAGVVSPLIEVPVLVGLVYVALWACRHFYRLDSMAAISAGSSGAVSGE